MKISSLSSEELVDRLILTVINYSGNEDKIQNFPYIRKGDFAVLTQLCVGEKNSAGQYTVCLTVTNELFEKWGIPKEDLFEIAADNSKKMFPAQCQPLDKYIDQNLLNERIDLPEGIKTSEVFVISNKQHFNGTAVLFYDPDILKQISDQMSTESLALLPAGVNQTFCIPIKNGVDLKECSELYEELSTFIGKENRLSEGILSFNSNSKTIIDSSGQSFDLNLKETVQKRHEHRR